MTQYRQGDVFLKQVVALPENAARVKDSPRGIVLAEGEATGHAHVLPAATVAMWSVGEQRYVVVAWDSTLTHEEHAHQVIPAGVYEVIQQREYSPESIRRVAD